MNIFTYKRLLSICFLYILLLVIIIFVSLKFGTAKILFADIFSDENKIILFNIRLPRILLAGLVGGTLGIVGACFQAILRNPLADPYILGVSSGASFGAVVFISFFGFVNFGVPIASFVFALLALFIVFYIASFKSRLNIETLILAGVIVSFFFSSCVVFILTISSFSEMASGFFWILGDLSSASFSNIKIIVPFILVGFLSLFYFSKEFNVMMLGEESAKSLGMEVERFKKIIFVIASLMVALSVSFCGPIGFVGLIIPHIFRMIHGSDHRMLLPISFLGGASFLILADMISRTVLSPNEIPVGVVTSFIGVPFFIILLVRIKRKVE